jgi:hypothetical protein
MPSATSGASINPASRITPARIGWRGARGWETPRKVGTGRFISILLRSPALLLRDEPERQLADGSQVHLATGQAG